MMDLVRIVSDWLENGTNGVNALLPSVPRDGGDPQPANVLVYDETRDNRPARGRLPDADTDLPALVVGMRTLTQGREIVTDDGYLDAELVIQYAAKNVDAYKAKRDGYTVLRAASWSLRRLRRSDLTVAGRTRNQVTLITVEPVRFEPWFERVDDTLIVGTLAVPVTARDHFSI